MQVTEVLLYNSPNSVYVSNNNLTTKQNIVVSLSGSLELGIVKNVGVNVSDVELAEFVRIATKEDMLTKCENCKMVKKLLPEIKKEADKLVPGMKISHVAINLDKTKLVVNYTSEERVDFRELIKILSNNYKMRIEMRQIGNRDESKMIGAMGVCGRETCCKLFLSDFDKVSIKMAKNQNIALNPNRINGMCGRLLCCLKYEDEFYNEMQKKMPKINSKVNTPDGFGTVESVDFLKETVKVAFVNKDTTEVKVYDLKDIQKDKK